MSASPRPMTVGELIKYLQELQMDDAFVMLDCEDDYYSGPLELSDISPDEAVFIREHEGKHYSPTGAGGWVENGTQMYGGCWCLAEDYENRQEYVDQRVPCIKIGVGT